MDMRWTRLRTIWLTCLGASPALANGASTAGSGWTTWIVGLACGVALMIAFDFDWRSVPERARRLLMAVRQKSGWAAVAAGSLGVILFY